MHTIFTAEENADFNFRVSKSFSMEAHQRTQGYVQLSAALG